MSIDTLDHQTEDALRTALARAAQPHGAPDGLQQRLAAHTYRTHSARPVVVAGLAGAAALTGVGFLAAGGPTQTPAGSGSGRGATSTTRLSQAQLTAEVTEAVDDQSSDIFMVHTTASGGQFNSSHWLSPDGNTLRVETFNADGSAQEDESFVKQGADETVTDVNYGTDTWWTTVVPLPQTFTCGQCASGTTAGLPPGGMVMGAPTSAAGVAWLVNQAGFTKTGQIQTVDGVANAYAIESPTGGFATPVTSGGAFEMQTPSPGAMQAVRVPAGTAAPTGLTMWIDPTTNLPVQVVMAAGTITSDVSWLTPTAANDALLVVTPPAGFSEVAVPAGAFDQPAPAGTASS